MVDVAWVGSKLFFERKFKTNKSYFVDNSTNTKYWCIDDETKLHGLRFDRVEFGYIGRIINVHDYYTRLCSRIERERLK